MTTTPEERAILAKLGRKGGQVKGRKGFAAMPDAQKREIQAAGVAKRKELALAKITADLR